MPHTVTIDSGGRRAGFDTPLTIPKLARSVYWIDFSPTILPARPGHFITLAEAQRKNNPD
jgi:hypothetical protein